MSNVTCDDSVKPNLMFTVQNINQYTYSSILLTIDLTSQIDAFSNSELVG